MKKLIEAIKKLWSKPSFPLLPDKHSRWATSKLITNPFSSDFEQKMWKVTVLDIKTDSNGCYWIKFKRDYKGQIDSETFEQFRKTYTERIS